jgi:ferric-dicitrate binding protein FerR (iron transport regulator)
MCGGLRVRLAVMACWVAGCVPVGLREYRGEPHAAVVEDVQLYTPRIVELDRNVAPIRVTVSMRRVFSKREAEDFVHNLPVWLPLRVEETAYSFRVHCKVKDCEWLW